MEEAMFLKREKSSEMSKCLWVVAALVIILFATPTFCQKMKEPQHPLDFYSFSKDELNLTMHGKDYHSLGNEVSAAVVSDIEKLKSDSGNDWLVMIDRITGKPSLVEGGVPWIPGRGWNNNIKAQDIGVSDFQALNNQVPLEKVDEIAKEFLKKYPNLFNVDIDNLELAKDSSGPMLDYLYNVNYRFTYKGLPVENAWLNFHLNNGNMVLCGATYISDSIKALDPTPSISLDTAWDVVFGYIGEKLGFNDEITEPGRLIIVPMLTTKAYNGEYYEIGSGMEYKLVYVMGFRKESVTGTWEARVDAHTGELLSFKDTNAYGHIQGGVYKTDKNPTQTEVTMPFPYANYSGTTSFADINGDFSGTTGTCTMTGRTGSATIGVGGVKITDNCGSISLASDANGLIDFKTSTGTDCTTPGVGGAGNTHSARTQYWNVSQIKIKAYTYLSSNTWLRGLLTDKVNQTTLTCNAYWDGTNVNFFKSSTYCGNTGEIPGVSLHEWGHGMDANDGNGSSPDYGTGETYGDTTALLQTHQSCLGGGFFLSYNPGCGNPPSQGTSYHNCGGYGNCCTDCSGVRDVDYAKHTQSTTPATLTFAKACPTSTNYKGPCGREGHCESYVSTEANWDLAVRDLVTWGLDSTTAWQLFDKFWYASAPNRLAAFVCTADASTGTGNLFNQYRVVDDCDGNLSNGTPHASAIWNALHRHQIGNSSAVNTDNNCGCATLSTPSLSGSAGNASVTLSWSAISGATSYDIYRNETSCTSGFTKIGNTTSTSFTDSPLVNAVTYYYRIQALGVTGCPPSAMSNCLTLTPSGSSCAAPSSLTNNTAADLDACADTGVRITWTADPGNWGDNGSGTRTYNVLRNGTSIAGTLSYGTTQYTDTTGTNGTSYTYTVRYNNGCGLNATTTGVSATDNIGPGAPTISSVTDADACATSGVIITWGAASGATGYDLRVDGSTVVNNVTSPYTYTPGDNSSHNYEVMAKNASCAGSWSTAVAGTDANNAATPTILGDSSNLCPSVNVLLSTEAGMSSYQWYLEGSPIGGANAYQYTATTTGNYSVSYTNLSGCPGTSTPRYITITACPLPPEIAVGSNYTWTVTQTSQVMGWNSESTATGYRVYRGTKGQLPELLLNINQDFCTRYDGTDLSLDVTSDNPVAIDGTNRVVYYLIVAYNGSGEGPAGNATAGPRVVNTTGSCP
jgi:hypothetical protein